MGMYGKSGHIIGAAPCPASFAAPCSAKIRRLSAAHRILF